MGYWSSQSALVVAPYPLTLRPFDYAQGAEQYPERSRRVNTQQSTVNKLRILATNPKYRGVAVQKSISADGADFAVAEKATQGNVVEVSAE